MPKAARLFNLVLTAVCFVSWTLPAQAAMESVRTRETGLYRDIFEENIYHEGLQFLHLDRLWKKLRGKKWKALDINAFDEVPDSLLFQNRHAKERMSSSALQKGACENEGPDLSQFTVTRGKMEGLHPGFFIQDARGDDYLLKFDSNDAFELATALEVITSRFFYAIGYNVPQYTVATFDSSSAQVGSEAIIYDDSGFKKKLTQERLDKYLMFMPQDDEGRLRVSASKMLEGENKGYFVFHGKRKEDPMDGIDHERLRALRALRVFCSWLNIYDMRESNTMDMVESMSDGSSVLRHYLFDFNDSLGSASLGAKPPMVTHEFLMDYGQVGKAFFTLGFWKKPWQKRWDEVEQTVSGSPALGYFDNRYFDPGAYKTQLPYYAFKDLTRADAFWAAKIIMAFSDEDIREIIKTGKFSNPEDAETLAKILIERRDLIGKYWFSKACPIDHASYQNGRFEFKDLAVVYGFEEQAIAYKGKILEASEEGKRHGVKIADFEFTGSFVDVTPYLGGKDDFDMKLRRSVSAHSCEGKAPYVRIQIRNGQIAGIRHQD